MNNNLQRQALEKIAMIVKRLPELPTGSPPRAPHPPTMNDLYEDKYTPVATSRLYDWRPSLQELVGHVPEQLSLHDFVIMRDPRRINKLCLAKRTRTVSKNYTKVLNSFHAKRQAFEKKLEAYDKKTTNFQQWVLLVEESLPDIVRFVRKLTPVKYLAYSGARDSSAMRTFHCILHYTFGIEKSLLRKEMLLSAQEERYCREEISHYRDLARFRRA